MLLVLRNLAFGLWAAAMAGFAFIFAPIAFHTIGPTPQFATTIAATVTAITSFGYACAAIAILASIIDLRNNRWMMIPIAAAIAMSALGYYEVHAIVPEMQRTALQTPAYEALHHRSSTIYSAILLLGICGWLSSFALSSRSRCR